MDARLERRRYEAFREELVKEAIVGALGAKALSYGAKTLGSMGAKGSNMLRSGVKSVGEGAKETVNRVMHPIKSLRKGWDSMSPRKEMAGMNKAKTQEYMKSGKFFGRGAHLRRGGKENIPLMDIVKGKNLGGAQGRASGVAEELSRRGWTGKGDRLKYAPVGEKSMIAGFAGSSVPSVLDAKKNVGPSGSGGTAEMGLGELAGNLGFVAGAGAGFIPSMATWYLANKAGSSAGRIIDRMRGGASFGDAMSAPTREEALEQLKNVSKYYG